ncbi:MAG: hypothetical protein J7J91_02665 [Deltaproteobacteria bacterium]|nr:hypothetical protein [Deltaproteobacteria bacterium]
MNTSVSKTGFEGYLKGIVERSEKLSYYPRTRGWGFVLTWAHRVAGLILILYMFFHIYTLSGLYHPARFASKMKFLHNFFFSFLEWALAVPVIFHALNGTRLILYEVFGVRDDNLMIRQVFFLSAIYVLTLGVFILMGNQQVSAALFWVMLTIAGAMAATILYKKLRHTENSVLWKLQRISGAFLLPMITGHMFFMHLNYKTGHDVEIIIARMSSTGIKLIDFALVLSVFFHAGFGLYTIASDYVGDKRFRGGLAVLIVLVMLVFAYAGTKLVFSI